MSENGSTVDIPTILIVEDSKVVHLELKRRIEEDLGFNCEVVTDYDSARDYIRHHARDIFLAILDLHLPGSPNGEIVDLFCSVAVPSIVFTSDFSEATRQRMQSKNIIDYVVKDSQATQNLIDYIRRLYRNRGIKVLAVEDSESFRYFLCGLLYKQMFQVLDVPDAESALKYLAADDDIRLVLVDYALPGMDGVDFTKAVRSRYSRDEMAVIGISSSTDPMLTARFIKSGANDYISKPFEPEELYSRVDNNVSTLETISALREANRVKNQFLGMAVHDLRSPINGINGLCEMMLKDLCGPLNEEQREIIEFVHEANMHMNAMVNDLLDISVIEAGRLKLNLEKLDFRQMVDKRLSIHLLAAKEKAIKVSTSYQDFPEFEFDQRRMAQVIDNLMTNAIKFSPPSSSVEVYLTKEDGAAQFCVCDNGQGIPPGEEELVFQSFQKTSVKPTAGESSTGLGLPIVKKIVEAHGGRVWVESVYGEGANFCLSLPLIAS